MYPCVQRSTASFFSLLIVARSVNESAPAAPRGQNTLARRFNAGYCPHAPRLNGTTDKPENLRFGVKSFGSYMVIMSGAAWRRQNAYATLSHRDAGVAVITMVTNPKTSPLRRSTTYLNGAKSMLAKKNLAK